MNTTNKYLNRLADLRGLRSDYAIAKYLGLSTAHVSIWRNEGSQFSDDMAFRIARELDLPAIEIIASIGSERAKEQSTRDGWREVLAQFKAQHVVPVFIAAILATFAYRGGVLDTRASLENKAYSVPTLSAARATLKIMFNRGNATERLTGPPYVTPFAPTPPFEGYGAFLLVAAFLLFRRRGATRQ